MRIKTKKKIRGWKRRIKHIERWKQRVLELNMEVLNREQRDYVKIWIHPFYALPRIAPPAWYNRLLLEAMLEVHESWNRKLKELQEEYDLKIWLHEPHFIESQVVVAFKDNLHFYDGVFHKASLQRPFPFHKFSNLKNKLENFKWELHIEATVYSETDIAEFMQFGLMSEKEAERIRKKAFHIYDYCMNEQPERMYSFKKGDIWVGTLKTDREDLAVEDNREDAYSV